MNRVYTPSALMTLILFLTFASLAPATPISRDSTARIGYAMENYRKALGSENEGLIVSSLVQVLRLKALHPQVRIDAYVRDLTSLSLHCPCPALRHRVHLTLLALSEPRLLPHAGFAATDTPDAVFQTLSRCIADSLLAGNGAH